MHLKSPFNCRNFAFPYLFPNKKMCITFSRGSHMHINYHARSVTRANLTQATLASSCDASKSDASNLTKADASILKIADINFAWWDIWLEYLICDAGGRFPHFYVIVFQGLWFQAFTRNQIRCVFKSFHSGERFQKFAVTVCVFARYVWMKTGSVTKCLRIQTNPDTCRQGLSLFELDFQTSELGFWTLILYLWTYIITLWDTLAPKFKQLKRKYKHL